MSFSTEADLCLAFAETVPSDWTIYNETAGFDMVLVHESGVQIAIEAKLKLNPKVLAQVIETRPHWNFTGPDFRAVLIGNDGNHDLRTLAAALGVTVMTVARKNEHTSSYGSNSTKAAKFFSRPKFPKVEPFKQCSWGSFINWFDQVPAQRVALPEYVPDVPAGVSGPAILGPWKIQAIKVCVWVKRTGSITRADFKALGIDPGRWMTGHWLKKGKTRGNWVAGPAFPLDQFKTVHPTVVGKVIADFDKWSVDNGLVALGGQEALI